MCLVAYLSAFGVTVGMASVALSVLGPLAVVSVVLALGFAIWRTRIRSHRDLAHKVAITEESHLLATGSTQAD
jgi:hypothetical protein